MIDVYGLNFILLNVIEFWMNANLSLGKKTRVFNVSPSNYKKIRISRTFGFDFAVIDVGNWKFILSWCSRTYSRRLEIAQIEVAYDRLILVYIKVKRNRDPTKKIGTGICRDWKSWDRDCRSGEDWIDYALSGGIFINHF